MDEVTNVNKKKLIFSSIMIIIFIVAIIYLTIRIWPYLVSLKTKKGQENFKNWVNKFGAWGFLVVLSLQILQIVVAFLPGEVTETLAGMMYGVFGGIALCMIGIVIATLIIYFLVRLLGKPFISLFLSPKNEKRYEYFKRSKHIEALFLFAFLLPGTPKDILIFIAPATPVKLWRFIIISLIGRIPSLLLSALIGHYLSKGQFTYSIIYVIITIVGAALGIIFNKPIIRWLETKVLR